MASLAYSKEIGILETAVTLFFNPVYNPTILEPEAENILAHYIKLGLECPPIQLCSYFSVDTLELGFIRGMTHFWSTPPSC